MSRHVLLAVWNLGRGGAERMVVDLARRLPKRGYIPRIVALGGGGPMEEEIRAAGIDLEIGPETLDRRETRAFAQRVLASLPSDTIVHTHLGADHWLGWPAKRRGYAWVSTCHNDDRDDPWWKRRLRVWAWNRAHAVVCESETVKRFWVTQGLSPKRVQVIPNGIDLARFTPKTRLTYGDVPLIVTIGRLAAQKRQEWLLRALAPIHVPWRLELVGDGALRGPLEALADTLGIRGRVSFRGAVSDVRPFLQRADLFAFPSAWEGQGIAVLEAAASGVPLLLSDRPAFREWLDADAATFVADDVAAWTEAFEHALRAPETMQAQGWKAYEAACRFGSLEKMIDAYVACYESVVAYAHSARQ